MNSHFSHKNVHIDAIDEEHKPHLENNGVFQNWQKYLEMTSFYFLAAKNVQGQVFPFDLASERLLENNLLILSGCK